MTTSIYQDRSNWEQKSADNLLASSLLLNNKLSNQSVHCSYYSCVQYIFHVLNHQFGMEICEVENESKRPPNKTGTHRWLREFIFDSISSKNKRAADNFYNVMIQLKTARNKADYCNEIVRADEAHEIKIIAEKLLKVLKKHYEL